MADLDDEIEIKAEFKDGVSDRALRAAKSVDELGDEAAETAVELEAMGEAADDAADDLDKLDKSAKRNKRALDAQKKAVGQARDELGRFVKQAKEAEAAEEDLADATENLDRWYKRLFNTLSGRGGGDGGGGGFFGKLGEWSKGLFSFGKVFKFAFMGLKFSAIVVGIRLIATAIAGLGAAAYSAVAGLAPLSGLLVAYPGMVGAFLQAMATFKLGTAGVGEMIKVFSNPEATAEEIAKAVEGAAQSQIKFARAVSESADAWKEVRRNVGGKLFEGMDKAFKNMSETYLPIVNKHLGNTAEVLNKVVRYQMDWLTSTRGQQTMNDIMADNVDIIEDMGFGLGNVVRTIANLVRAGGPMLKSMAQDFRELTGGLAGSSARNQDDLEAFFNRSYQMAKDVTRVLGYYVRGLYNIGVESGVMSRWIGTNLDDIGKRFEEWTDSAGGRKSIRRFFADMIPVVQELALWIRDLGKAFGEVTYGSGDFVSISKGLRENTIPLPVDALNWISDRIVIFVEDVVQVYKNFKEAGATGGIWRALQWFGNGIRYVSEKAAGLGDGTKKLIAFATGVYAAYKILSKIGVVGGLAGVASALTGGKVGGMWGVQKVFVVNMVPGGMGGAAGGAGAGAAAGGAAGTASKLGRFAKFGRFLGRWGGPIAAAGIGLEILNWGNRRKEVATETSSYDDVLSKMQGGDVLKGAAEDFGFNIEELAKSISIDGENSIMLQDLLKRMDAESSSDGGTWDEISTGLSQLIPGWQSKSEGGA